MLIVHIFVAIFGLICSSLLYILPSNLKYYMSMAALLVTLLSGTVLVISTGANLVKSCASGIIYVCIVSVLMYKGRAKLAGEFLNTEE